MKKGRISDTTGSLFTPNREAECWNRSERLLINYSQKILPFGEQKDVFLYTDTISVWLIKPTAVFKYLIAFNRQKDKINEKYF